jgi:hypothetical protein
MLGLNGVELPSVLSRLVTGRDAKQWHEEATEPLAASCQD